MNEIDEQIINGMRAIADGLENPEEVKSLLTKDGVNIAANKIFNPTNIQTYLNYYDILTLARLAFCMGAAWHGGISKVNDLPKDLLNEIDFGEE